VERPLTTGWLGTDLISPDRYVRFERRVTENRWLVGSTGSPLDPDLSVTRPTSGALRINGTKFFCTGARVADRIVCFASDPDSGERLVIELDARRPEIKFLDDWDILGERLSASHGLTLNDYEASPEDVLGSLGDAGSGAGPHRPPARPGGDVGRGGQGRRHPGRARHHQPSVRDDRRPISQAGHRAGPLLAQRAD
jgi:hypothetical protein